MPSLEAAADEIGGVETLGALGARAGILFGASIPQQAMIADADWRAAWQRVGSRSFTLGAMEMDDVQPSAGTFDFSAAESALALADSDAQKLLHVLVYPATAPAWMSAGATSGNWGDLVDDHIAGCAPMVARCERIQVANEAIHQYLDGSGGSWRDNWLNTASGNDGSWVVRAFATARALFPGKVLAYGENYMEMDQATGKRATLLSLLDMLGDTVDAVSLQGHLQTNWDFGGAALRSLLRELITTRGLTVQITEADVANGTFADMAAFDRLAADWTERFLSIALEEGVEWINTWGTLASASFWHSSIPDHTQRPLPWDDAGRPTQIERAIRRALRGAAGA